MTHWRVDKYLEDTNQTRWKYLTMKHPPRNIVIDWLNTIWSTTLPSNSKLIACNLRKYMNGQNDMAWPSVARIAGECGISENTVRSHLKILAKEGWISQAGTSKHDTKIYQARYPSAIHQTPPSTIEPPSTIGTPPLQPLRYPPSTIEPELNNRIKQVELNNNRVREADLFELFYSAYPKKVGKSVAKKAFARLKPTPEFTKMLITDCRKRIDAGEWCTGNDKQFIPGPAPYLNQRKWEDEIIPRAGNQPTTNYAEISANFEEL